MEVQVGKGEEGKDKEEMHAHENNEEAFGSAISQNYDFKVKVSKRKAIVIRSIHAA